VRQTAARALTLVAAHGAAALRPFFAQAVAEPVAPSRLAPMPATVTTAAVSFAALVKASPNGAADQSLVIECVRAVAASLAHLPTDAPTLLVQARVDGAHLTHMLPTVDERRLHARS
jgi:AcrR family transcriptional regulator